MARDFKADTFAVHAHALGELCINARSSRQSAPAPAQGGPMLGQKLLPSAWGGSPCLRQLHGPSPSHKASCCVSPFLTALRRRGLRGTAG